MKKFIIIILLLTLSFSLFGSEFKDGVLNFLEQKDIPKEGIVVLISMLPIFELRGAIPIGIHTFNLPYYKVVPLSIFGNMLPIFLILLLFDYVTKIFMKFPFTKNLLTKIFEKTRKKGKLIEKYEELGLILFVAIPLPITGAWTGSLAAYLFGISFWKSILFLFIGVIIASVIVTTITALGKIGGIIAVVALLALGIQSIIKIRKKA